jgi:tetratricopeptide (TPR) repeat protein
MTDLDAKLTFDSFVVGPANRLAFAAAKRAADSPGTSYNPIFVYSASGLGKSHILIAIAHHAGKLDTVGEVEYMTLEKYLEELTEALEVGDSDGFKNRYTDLAILLLDDVQFLTGQPEAQEMLLRTLGELSAAGSQIVLASDRPPAEINGLDARLLSRFSGGLIVDIGVPQYETRVAILRKKAEEALYKSAVAVTPPPPQAHKNLGDQAYAYGDHDGVRIQYEKAVKLSPWFGDDVYLRLDAMAYQANDCDVALLLWRRALDLNPRNEAVSANLEMLSGE